LSAAWPAYFSDPYVTPTTVDCSGNTASGTLVLGIISDFVWVFTPNSSFPCTGLPASFAIPGPFNTLSSTNSYLFSLVTEEPPSSGAPAVFNLVDSNFGLGNWTNLEGQFFLGWVFSPGGIVAVSATGSQVFFDLVSMTAGQPAITNVGAFTLSAPPVGNIILGNFWNDTEGNDICIANGSEIAVFSYVGTGSAPLWSLVDTLTASGSIGAITTGSLVVNGSDVVVQTANGAEVFSSHAFTGGAPPPPPPTTYTLSVSSSGPGTLSQTPTGTSFSSGTPVTLTAVPSAGASLSSWSGACAGAGAALTCDLVITSNLVVEATFTTPAPTPSLAVAPPTQTVSAGTGATYAVTPQNFSATPTLTATCSIPKGACSVVGGNLVATTTASSTSSAPTHMNWYRVLPGTGALLAALCLFSLLIPFKPRRRLTLATLGLLMLAGCGSGSKSAAPPTTILGTPAGAYTITVTATSGSTVITSQATLNVH
jgi:hypothetical protein